MMQQQAAFVDALAQVSSLKGAPTQALTQLYIPGASRAGNSAKIAAAKPGRQAQSGWSKFGQQPNNADPLKADS